MSLIGNAIHNNTMTELQFLEREIEKWKLSKQRNDMITGKRYFRNEHDILTRKREVIGEGGTLETVDNLPNNQIIDNQYKKMVVQKVNYILGKPLTLDTENEDYEDELSKLINRKFHKTMKTVCEDSLNCGIGWLFLYLDENARLKFKRFNPIEILPFWKDSENTELDLLVRVYEVEGYEGKEEKIFEKVEIYRKDRVELYQLEDNKLIPDKDSEETVINYIAMVDDSGEVSGYSWGAIPIIAFKYNHDEIPLINNVKILQDAINLMLSDFENAMQEEQGGTSILVIKNYEGTNLGEFRKNLMTHRAVKVGTRDGKDGGLDSITVEVNSDNYKVVLELLKKALIENAFGFDAKDDRLSGTPNQMNIQSMYSDIELDSNGIETEYQSSFEYMLDFVNIYLLNETGKAFDSSDMTVIFNRDMLMNETEIIDNCQKSKEILSDETIISQHPWVSDVQRELERLEEEKTAAIDNYSLSFPPPTSGEGDD